MEDPTKDFRNQSDMHHFHRHSFGQNSVMWPSLTAADKEFSLAVCQKETERGVREHTALCQAQRHNF